MFSHIIIGIQINDSMSLKTLDMHIMTLDLSFCTLEEFRQLLPASWAQSRPD